MHDFYALYGRLRDHFGFLNWWPGETEDEIVIGAILTQQTSWKNVEKAISNLRKSNALSISKIAATSLEKLESMVRPSGFYKQKARRLLEFSKHVIRSHGSLKAMLGMPVDDLRRELLSLDGIGPETADSIILYAAGKPVFVVDAYTMRIVDRIFNMREHEYSALQKKIEGSIEKDLDLYKDFHAQFVELGKTFCKKNPLCEGCPANGICSYYAKNKNKKR
ncbi:MAG: endonuclease III domain-containing protein [Candidatus Micrarchaeaceae archaeon]